VRIFQKVGLMQKKEPKVHSFHFHDLVIDLHPEVYDPAEDSFLLLETLNVNPGDAVLEIGTGCGIIALACACRGSHVVCTDINPFAVQLTRRNSEHNRTLLKGSLEVRHGDLFSVLQKDERFDVIIFNPPYLPTTKNDKVGGWFDVATDGGRDGLRETRRFINGLKNHLSCKGRAYFIFSSFANRTRLENYLEKEKYSFEVSAHRRFEDEDLDVYCIAPVD
jgi:release factor glutamine methyltransferase